MERKFKTIRKRHSDDDGDFLPEFDDGIDSIIVNIPDGKKFSRYELVKDCFLGDCKVITAPRDGKTGKVRFRVKWNYAILGKANYDLKVYIADKQAQKSPLNIAFLSHNWEERAKGAIESGRKVIIKVTGPHALLLYPLIWKGSARELMQDPQIRNARDPGIAITLAICATIGGVLIFAGITAILMFSIEKGKCAKANFSPGNLVMGELPGVDLVIEECSGGQRKIAEVENYEEDYDEYQGEEESDTSESAESDGESSKLEELLFELVDLLKKKV